MTTTQKKKKSSTTTTTVDSPPAIAHIYFLLDRSGSMADIATDVIGGFNSFLKEQLADGDDAIMTLVQFDSQNPQEIWAESQPLRKIAPLTSATFVPRGSTPLYDAMGMTIASAKIHLESLPADAPREEIFFVTFTDGEENASKEYDQASIFSLIKKCEKDGWTFTYLGANQDAYAESELIGGHVGNTTNFVASEEGTDLVFQSLTRSMVRERDKIRSGAIRDNTDFFENDKLAEQ
jgi:hypothetical protein